MELESLGSSRFKITFNTARVSSSELITYIAQNHQLKNIAIKEPEIELIVREIFEKAQ